MELDYAKDLIRKMATRDGFEVHRLSYPFENSSVIKRAADDLDFEIWKRIHVEPEGDFSIVTQVTSPKLTKSLRLSAKFEKYVHKLDKQLRKDGATLILEEGRLALIAAKRGGQCDADDLIQQEKFLMQFFSDLQMVNIPKTFKMDALTIFVSSS